jgi:hypothetical protein
MGNEVERQKIYGRGNSRTTALKYHKIGATRKSACEATCTTRV